MLVPLAAVAAAQDLTQSCQTWLTDLVSQQLCRAEEPAGAQDSYGHILCRRQGSLWGPDMTCWCMSDRQRAA